MFSKKYHLWPPFITKCAECDIRYLPSLQIQFQCTVCTASFRCKQGVSGNTLFTSEDCSQVYTLYNGTVSWSGSGSTPPLLHQGHHLPWLGISSVRGSASFWDVWQPKDWNCLNVRVNNISKWKRDQIWLLCPKKHLYWYFVVKL